jgi:hypothetical protein
MHVWECGEWRSKGVCSKGITCGLQHILRAENEKEAKKEGLEADQEFVTDTQGDVPVEGGFEEQSAFIEFDHGTPADPESDSEGEEDSEHEGSEVSDDDDEKSDGTGKLSRQSSPTAIEVEEEDSDEDEDEVLGIVM